MAAWDSRADTNRSAGLRLRSREERFGVVVDVGHPWPGERPEHAQLPQQAVQHGRTHGVAVIQRSGSAATCDHC